MINFLMGVVKLRTTTVATLLIDRGYKESGAIQWIRIRNGNYATFHCVVSLLQSVYIWRNCIGLSRYIAITYLPIIAVFGEYLRQFLIDFNQIYRHSIVCQKTRLCEFFELLCSSGFRARRRRDFFSWCACHGPSTASHYHNLA